MPRSPLAFAAPAGLTLRGFTAGEGARTVVFTQGAGLTVESYLPALSGLFPQARVYGLNARGHGGSDVPAAFADWHDAVDDLRAFCEQTFATPVVLAGHSFGALVSLWLAAEAPRLAAGLLLLDPLVPHRRHEPWPPSGAGRDGELIARTLQRREIWPSLAEAGDGLRGRGVYAGWQPGPFAEFLASAFVAGPDGSARLCCPPWMEAAVYGGRPGKELFGWAAALRVPAVLLGGADTHIARPEALQDLADAMPLATVLTVKGSHTFPQEHPQETAAALAYALGQLAVPGRHPT